MVLLLTNKSFHWCVIEPKLYVTLALGITSPSNCVKYDLTFELLYPVPVLIVRLPLPTRLPPGTTPSCIRRLLASMSMLNSP